MKKIFLNPIIGCLILVIGVSYCFGTQYEYDNLNRLSNVIYDNGLGITYTYDDSGNLVDEKIFNRAFITTWDTSLGDGTTVTLALGGTVNADINWGDGSPIQHVTTLGPHIHDYGVDGIYTVSVTGSVTGYNSYQYGGGNPYSEEAKLRSVDNWGELGFTSMNHAFFRCTDLVSVPNTTDGIATVTDMSYMFEFGYLFNQDISGWDTSSVTN